MKNLMPFAAMLLLINFSCTKEEKKTPQSQNAYSGFIPLSIGNYWVYEQVRIDTLGNETIGSMLDSAYVSADTIINGNTYYLLSGSNLASNSIGNFIRNNGYELVHFDFAQNKEVPVFTVRNPGSYFETDSLLVNSSTWFYINSKASPQRVSRVVSAGSFNCYERITTVIPGPAQTNYPWGTRINYRYYNENVGVVSSQFHYISSPDIYEMRLVRYRVN